MLSLLLILTLLILFYCCISFCFFLLLLLKLRLLLVINAYAGNPGLTILYQDEPLEILYYLLFMRGNIYACRNSTMLGMTSHVIKSCLNKNNYFTPPFFLTLFFSKHEISSKFCRILIIVLSSHMHLFST